MYNHPLPSSPSSWASSSAHQMSVDIPVSPSSPTTRAGRLRGLSYLRNYTHTHLLSRDHSSGSPNRPSLTRATSYPISPRPSTGATSPITPTAPRSTNAFANARNSDPENVSSLPPGQNASLNTASEVEPAGYLSTGLAIDNPTTSSPNPLNLMARTRSATVGDAAGILGAGGPHPSAEAQRATTSGEGSRGTTHQLPSIRFTAHQDPRVQRPSLVFGPMARILPTGKEIIKVGRYSERDSLPQQAVNVPSSAPVGFKSKVVSRRHCEFWCSGGRWYIKDVKSSSGTFLNHIRLSSPGTESRPFPVNDGDIVQLGIDFKGGEEMIFRCVKIRVELNKGWQNGPSSFNVQSHKRLRELNNVGKPAAGGSSQDCSICLGPIAPCQSLFVAPCSHTWHYKCIRVIINGPHWPHFICPNCRSVADLEAELDDPYATGEWEEEPADVNSATESSEPTAPVATQNIIQQQLHQQDSSESPRVSLRQENVLEQNNGDSTDRSDEAEIRESIHQASEDLGYMNIRDSASLSTDSQPDEASNSTVAPVEIVNRRLGSGAVADISARLGRPDPCTGRDNTRTPSPNGLPSSLNDLGTEGPMTPRNDVGPFIFDGTAGRVSDPGAASAASLNLVAEAEDLNPTQSNS